MKKQAKCIDNTGYEEHLTVGKTYEVLNSYGYTVEVLSDNEFTRIATFDDRFEIVSKNNSDKIVKILIVTKSQAEAVMISEIVNHTQKVNDCLNMNDQVYDIITQNARFFIMSEQFVVSNQFKATRVDKCYYMGENLDVYTKLIIPCVRV